jgi:alkanesulfonate monooxygenase SsuD/methylene tetrahydromethanopterin reductase-like flavin-dependent oxidoreductase (luciferase family)
MKLGLTLPSFRRDPEAVLRVAAAAESVGVDAVFVFDHLFRRVADGSRRPALEGTTLLAAVAAATTRIHVGILVARATLRPPATLAHTFETVRRLAPGRLLVAIGSGDSASRDENETFGLAFGDVTTRVRALRGAVVAARDSGFPVWVGGQAGAVRAVAAAEADGWNCWGADVDVFARDAAVLRATAARTPFTCSWGGLVVVEADDDRARAKAARLRAPAGTVVGAPAAIASALEAYRDAGAAWAMLGPIDSSNADNAHRLGEVAARLH